MESRTIFTVSLVCRRVLRHDHATARLAKLFFVTICSDLFHASYTLLLLALGSLVGIVIVKPVEGWYEYLAWCAQCMCLKLSCSFVWCYAFDQGVLPCSIPSFLDAGKGKDTASMVCPVSEENNLILYPLMTQYLKCMWWFQSSFLIPVVLVAVH